MISIVDQGWGIGKNNKLLYHLPKDMEHFKKTTMGQIVVLGRKNYESIPERYRPLPGRVNVVMSKNLHFHPPGCLVRHFVTDVLRMAEIEKQEIWIIGGTEIYRAFLPHTKRLILTHVDAISPADRLFPSFGKEWQARTISEHEKDEENHFPFKIVEYTR